MILFSFGVGLLRVAKLHGSLTFLERIRRYGSLENSENLEDLENWGMESALRIAYAYGRNISGKVGEKGMR